MMTFIVFAGKLVLKIPWKNLYSEPVVAEIDGLYLLVRPNTGKSVMHARDALMVSAREPGSSHLDLNTGPTVLSLEARLEAGVVLNLTSLCGEKL